MKNDIQDRMARVDNRKDNPQDNLSNKPSDFPFVPFGSTICPNCGSHYTKITRIEEIAVNARHRYHACKKCNARFRSEERLPFIDQKKSVRV